MVRITEKSCIDRQLAVRFICVFVLALLISFGQAAFAEELHFVFFNPDNEAKDPITAVSAMKPFADYMGEEIGVEFKIHYLLRKKDLERVLAREDVSLALLSPLYYVENKDRLGLVPFAMPFLDDDITYRLMVVVKKNSGFKTLNDLKGKSLAYTALGEDNYDMLNVLVFNNEIAVQTHFSKLYEVPSPSAAVMSVLYNQTDCACVTSGLYETLKELNPLIERESTGIFLSSKILRSPMCYIKGKLSEERIAILSKMLYTMHESPLGQQSLMPFNLHGFKEINAEAFTPMETLIKSAKSPLMAAKVDSKEEAPLSKPVVERLKQQEPEGSLTISKISHRYLKEDNAVSVQAIISPATSVKSAELIYQFKGEKRLTKNMEQQKDGMYTTKIELPVASSQQSTEDIIYEVKSGDTLGIISKKYYGEIKKWIMIATYNQLKNPNIIYVGQKLKIKQDGAFENITIDIWTKAIDTKEAIVVSPQKTLLITR